MATRGVGEDERLRTEYAELRRRYQVLTQRIGAIDEDIGRAQDAVREQVLREQRTDFAGERERVSARMTEIETSSPSSTRTTKRRRTAAVMDNDDLARMVYEVRSDVAVLRREMDEIRRWSSRESAGWSPLVLTMLLSGGLVTLLLLAFLVIRIGLP